VNAYDFFVETGTNDASYIYLSDCIIWGMNVVLTGRRWYCGGLYSRASPFADECLPFRQRDVFLFLRMLRMGNDCLVTELANTEIGVHGGCL